MIPFQSSHEASTWAAAVGASVCCVLIVRQGVVCKTFYVRKAGIDTWPVVSGKVAVAASAGA